MQTIKKVLTAKEIVESPIYGTILLSPERYAKLVHRVERIEKVVLETNLIIEQTKKYLSKN